VWRILAVPLPLGQFLDSVPRFRRPCGVFLAGPRGLITNETGAAGIFPNLGVGLVVAGRTATLLLLVVDAESASCASTSGSGSSQGCQVPHC
jgi:hypothetical protein